MSHCSMHQRVPSPGWRAGTRSAASGQMVEPTAAASHHSGVLVAMGSLETAVAARVEEARSDPALARHSGRPSRIGCSWCIDFGFYEGMHGGIDPAKVRAAGRLADERPLRRPGAGGPRVRGGGHRLPGRGLRRARRPDPAHLSDAEFVELAAWVALENFRSRFNAGLGLAQPGFLGHLRDPDGAVGRVHRQPLPELEADAAAFEEWRPLLFGIAYRMLGSAADAEDVVQDACVRWLRRGDEPVQSVRAYLVTIVTRLLPRRARLLAGEAGDLRGPVAARARRRRRAFGRRAGGLAVAGLPGAPRGAHAARACGVPAPRHLRLLVRRGGPVDGPVSRRLPPARCSGPKAHRGASPALRCRPQPRSRADGPLPGRLRHGRPVGPPGHAVRRRGGLDRRGREGPGGHAARGRAAPQLALPHQRGQEGPRRAPRPPSSTASRRPSSWTTGRSWRRSCSTSWTG